LNKLANLFIITAPSGCGKTTLVRELTNKITGIRKSVSYTTRAKRPNEEAGSDYYFVSKPEFEVKIQAGDFLEHAKVYDQYYGTSQSWVLKQLHLGIDVILEIDWQGAQQVKKRFLESISIFVLPPSISALKERIYNRKQDELGSIQQRLSLASAEISHYAEFDYLIVNQELNKAILDLETIVLASRYRTDLQKHKYQHLLEDLLENR
jgi:guanylate kinase